MKREAGGWKEISLKVLAVALAAVTWVVAVNEKNRSASAPTFDVVRDARVIVKNVPQGMVVTDAPTAVTVRLRGTRDLEGASFSEVLAVVNLAGATSGQHVLSAELLPPPGFEVVKSGAIRVNVALEEIVSAEFDVELVISAELALDGTARAVASPARVKVEGAASAVGRVTHVVALARTLVQESPGEAEPGEAEPDGGALGEELPERVLEAVAQLLALDDHGDPVSGVAVYPGTVLVRW